MDRDPNPNHERYWVPGLARGLRLLQQLTREKPAMTISEMADALKLPSSAVFRLVYTLESLGFLERVPGSKRYRTGTKVLRLGYEHLGTREIVQIARPHLEWLRAATDATAHLAVRDGRDAILLVSAPVESGLITTVPVGSRIPAHATATGLVLLSGMADREIEGLYRDFDLTAHTSKTPTTVPLLVRRVAKIRKHGYAISRSGYFDGIASVAAPVRDIEQRTIAAVNIVCLDTGATRQLLDKGLKDSVVVAALKISAQIGWSNSLAD